MGAAILFPKEPIIYNAFDGPVRNKMAALCLLSSIPRQPRRDVLGTI